jgi:hypothetical protein
MLPNKVTNKRLRRRMQLTRRLELISAKPFLCGAVAMHYRRAR